MKEICIVAPVYNEETTITEFVKQVSSILSEISSNYEIILVDDGSKDESWKIIEQEASKNNRIRAIKLSRNFGQHYAITAGLHHSNSNWTVIMDSDLQDRPSIIKELYKKAKEGNEVVFVSRMNRPETFLYLFAQKTFYYLLNLLSGLKFDSKQANFSIINHRVVAAFKSFPESSRFYSSIIKWLGFNVAEVKAQHGIRFSGRPSYTFKKRINLAIDIILAFSDRPLKFAIGFGLLMAFFATILVGWIIWGVIHSDFIVLGWPSIMAAIFFVGGSILIVLGIVGIYLGRVFREVKNRPLYVVSKIIN